MREPRCCFRVGRPRVTCTPSRVQTITRSNTRSLRRCPPGLIRAEPACSVRWARSLRRTERPVHHGSSRGSLQSLAPTRTSPHSRVPTHNSATCSRVRCQHYRMRVVGKEYSGKVAVSVAWLPGGIYSVDSVARARRHRRSVGRQFPLCSLQLVRASCLRPVHRRLL
jgi:hypothetical protein